MPQRLHRKPVETVFRGVSAFYSDITDEMIGGCWEMPIEKRDNNFVNSETGEIVFTANELKKAPEKEAIDKAKQVKSYLLDMGISSDLKITNRRSDDKRFVYIKEGYEFYKGFRADHRVLVLMKNISKNAKYFIWIFSAFVAFPSNMVLINGKSPTMKDLKRMSGLSEVTIRAALADLEMYEIIVRVKSNREWGIYMNPFIVCSGKYIEVDTYKMFEDTVFNHSKSLSEFGGA